MSDSGPQTEVERTVLVSGSLVAGKYRVDRLLASGGMGAVVKARHEVLEQDVAIKVMRPEIAADAESAQRFLREARAAAKISSDFVARVTDVDRLDDGTPFMVMEYLEGVDLADLVDTTGEIEVRDAVDYVMQALSGLDAAHKLGIVHRDLKPSNLFLVNGRRVKVLDFGISKVLDEKSTPGLKAGANTSTQAMLGTPRYMSPEQVASSKDVDGRTDIWSMGLILYQLLTKQFPFDGDNPGAILAAILTIDPTRPRSFREQIPVELERVVMRCLERDRGKRYAGARELMRALAPFASDRSRASLLEPRELTQHLDETHAYGREAQPAAVRGGAETVRARIEASPTLVAPQALTPPTSTRRDVQVQRTDASMAVDSSAWPSRRRWLAWAALPVAGALAVGGWITFGRRAPSADAPPSSAATDAAMVVAPVASQEVPPAPKAAAAVDVDPAVSAPKPSSAAPTLPAVVPASPASASGASVAIKPAAPGTPPAAPAPGTTARPKAKSGGDDILGTRD